MTWFDCQFFSQDMQLEIKVVFLVKWPSLRSAPHLSFQQKSPSFLPLCSVTLWISRPFPGQAAVVLAKTEPEQQCSLFPVGDREQMLHCRVLIQAMGKRELLTFFLYVTHVVHWLPPNVLCCEHQMLIRCFSLYSGPPQPTCQHWCSPCCGCWFQPAPFTLHTQDSPRPCAVRESKESIKGYPSRMAEFALPLFLYAWKAG